jgi:predicted CoA-binding protein
MTDDAIAARASALWFQLDCVDEASARRAQAAGLTVVMDRCIMVDHAGLLGRSSQRN